MTFWAVLIGAWVVLIGVGLTVLVLADRWDRQRWADHEDLTEHEAERLAMARAVARCRAHHPVNHPHHPANHPHLQEHRP